MHGDEDSSGLNGWLLGSLDETVSCLALSETRSPVNYVSSQRAPVLKLVPDSRCFLHSFFLPASPAKSSTSTSILPPAHLRSQSPVLPTLRLHWDVALILKERSEASCPPWESMDAGAPVGISNQRNEGRMRAMLLSGRTTPPGNPDPLESGNSHT